MTGAEIGDLWDEVTPYVARSMAKLRSRGLVRNLRAGTNKALYAITDAGREAIAKATGQQPQASPGNRKDGSSHKTAQEAQS